MNVLHIVLSLHTGGLERVVLDLIKESFPASNSIVVCLDTIGDHQVELDRENIPYYALDNFGKRKFITLKRIVSIIKKHKIDIIHTHNPGPHFYGCCVGMLKRVPVIHTKHGRNYPDNKKKVFKNYILSILSHKIACVSADASDVAINIEHVTKSKVVTILNGINIANYKNNPKHLYVNKTGNINIGIVARLSREKDHATLLKAFQIIISQISGVTLKIIGGGPLKQDLIELSNRLSINDSCVFMGNRNDVPEILKSVDVFVLSSITEGVSLTLLEAMAASIPIVCTDVGGNREVVLNGETGLIVPPKAPDLLANALLSMIKNREQRMEMGKAGYDRVKQKFCIANTAAEYDKLYKAAVNA